MAAGDVRAVHLGACQVTWNGVDLGSTKGGVDLAIKTETKRVSIDSFGAKRVDEWITKRLVEVKVPLAETSFASLSALLALTDATIGATLLTVNDGAGVALSATTKPLVLNPLGTAYGSDAGVTVLSAALTGQITTSYRVDQERVWALVFTGYPDATGKLLSFGEMTLPAYPAPATQPTPLPPTLAAQAWALPTQPLPFPPGAYVQPWALPAQPPPLPPVVQQAAWSLPLQPLALPPLPPIAVWIIPAQPLPFPPGPVVLPWMLPAQPLPLPQVVVMQPAPYDMQVALFAVLTRQGDLLVLRDGSFIESGPVAPEVALNGVLDFDDRLNSGLAAWL